MFFQKKYEFPAICYQVSFSVCRATAEKVPTLPDNNSSIAPAVLFLLLQNTATIKLCIWPLRIVIFYIHIQNIPARIAT